jgi:hypothetical protein
MQVTAPARRGFQACLLGALLAGGMAAAAWAQQQPFSNRFLGDACAGRFPDAVIGIARKSFCAGVLIAVVRTHALDVERGQATPAFCPDSPQADPRELSIQYLDWLDAHPELLEAPGIEGVVAMLAQHYPCPR